MNPFHLTRRSALAAFGATTAAGLAPNIALAATAARPWLATPPQLRAEAILRQLLQDPALKALQATIRAKLAASPRAQTLPDAARLVDHALAQWTNSLIFGELDKDLARPGFLWGTDDTPREWNGYRLGGVGTSGDNPDAIYRTASIAGGGRYEILGQYHPDSRPTQVLIEIHTADKARPSTMMTPTAKGGTKAPDPQAQSQINQDAFVVDAQGRFRITLASDAGAGPGNENWASPNHLVIPASGPVAIGVRDILSDWKQRASGLTVRRLDPVADAPAFGLAQVRELALRDLEAYVDFWSKFPDIWFGGLGPNKHSAPQQRPGGWGFVAGLNFHLAPDEAMVVTTTTGGARYTGFQLNDPWMIAPDARANQVCLNGSQVTPNADGSVTYVIAPKDPGAANWLDTTGLLDGIGILRWQAIPADLKGEGLIREVKVIKASEIATIAGLPRLTPAQRRRQLAARKPDYETRVR
ncbi:hypothetical protein WG901_16930 [Novosphingobium sp. PS1R-30]|uniref:DUF1214 domain-containing protein n=1 Tax=Novosphingobium anseongense TaxID=3133436 RepID=A0ABU8RZ32_9SPHN